MRLLIFVMVAPGTFLLSSIAIGKTNLLVIQDQQICLQVQPVWIVYYRIPAFLKPMMARNKPIPAPTPSFILLDTDGLCTFMVSR